MPMMTNGKPGDASAMNMPTPTTRKVIPTGMKARWDVVLRGLLDDDPSVGSEGSCVDMMSFRLRRHQSADHATNPGVRHSEASRLLG